MLTEEKIKKIEEYYATRDRWKQILEYRDLQPLRHPVKNLFYGDSITEAWPLHEFFPSHSILNRGLGGDGVDGLFFRMEKDVFTYHPNQVFILVGINGIEEDGLCTRMKHLASAIKNSGSKVYCSSILPLRYPDQWDRFQYQDKIIEINNELHEWATSGNVDGFIDYYDKVKAPDGQLAEECSLPDGTHLTFEGYRRMAATVDPYLEM